MNSTITQRKILPPAEGRAFWLGTPDNEESRWLQIDTQDDRGVYLTRVYKVTRVYTADGLMVGYTLTRRDKATKKILTYVVDVTANGGLNNVWICSCPDALNRVERRDCCKHVRSLKSALRAKPWEGQ
jgi:predicted nucleic acid-binding Zn finger protein